jgi:pimeloyl-ACP methyl ester carboxylesterase
MSRSRRHARPSILAVIAAVLVAFSIVAPSASARVASTRAHAAPPAAIVPRISWASCGGEVADFECATVRVPLDHDNPRGAKISLALSRLPASEPGRRIGTIFLNPGGPGGSGVGLVQAVGKDLFTPEIRARFDLLGFDPRGIAGSTPLQCFDTTDDALAVLAPFPFPYTRAEERTWLRADRAYASACDRRGGPIIDHMSTANVARDMDLLRRAVGDARMTFVGYSYGSYIGSTYANMFPEHVRAIVIDGVIDPVSYATGRGDQAETLPIDARLVSEQGSYQTLREFLALCDAGGSTCAFSDGNPRQRFDRLARRLLANPIELPDGEGGTFLFAYQDLVISALVTMYNPTQWPDYAAFLQAVDEASLGAAARALAGIQERFGRQDEPYQQVLEGYAGVWCSDGDNPDDPSAWARAARAADRRWPYFGRAWNWASICAVWPGQDRDRYAGPFNRRTANPVLVVGNLFDPATRYQDAVSTERMLPRARLLTVEGWGHTSLFLSTCADGVIARYLLAPGRGGGNVRCPVDVVPFAESPSANQAAERSSSRQSLPFGPLVTR